MHYKGYEVLEDKNSVIVEGVKDFDPIHTFKCGQCFRWLGESDGSHTGVAGGRVANIRYSDGKLVINNADVGDFTGFWFDYLDLGRDYSEIKQRLSQDAVMKEAILYGGGIRLLKQDIWETLVSFIISANNRIPMIMKVVSAISGAYGEKIKFNGRVFHTFPHADLLAASSIENLMLCRGGFRCRYILETSKLVAGGGFDPDMLDRLGTAEARNMLVKLPGVGSKVADCTLLYSGLKHDVFPTDVWVRRVMEELYFKHSATFSEIRRFAEEKFGVLAGFAQQYLFYYARENRIGAH